MKILLFDGSFKTTAFINRLASGLAVHHEVYIAGFNEELKHPVPGVRYIPLGSNQNKIRFITTAFYWAKKESLNTILRTFKLLIDGDKKSIQEHNLKIALKTIRPDIIHLQWTSVIAPFEEVLKAQQTPIILSQRGFHTNVKPFVYSENMTYLREYYPLFAGFHSVSKAITKNGDKIWSHPGKIDRVAYTGLPFSEWVFNPEYKKSKTLKLLSVGRAHWKKGYDYGLRACAVLKENTIPFHYTIIGGEGEEELQFLVHDLGLQENVSLLGRVPLEEVKEYMREASLMLMPSIEEGLPNVAVEAMAIGLPVAGFEIGGMPELIESGKEGWLVPSRDVEAMAEVVMEFEKMSLEEIESVRQAARRKVELQHNEEQMVEGMEGLYEEVLAAWGSRDGSGYRGDSSSRGVRGV